MTPLTLPPSSYSSQIRAWARAIAAGRPYALAGSVHHQSRRDLVQLFTDGNLEKRQDKLARTHEFLAPAFPKLDELIRRYVRSVPLLAYDSGQLDGGRMLEWLLEYEPLTLEQRDYVSCQYARQRALDRAALNRDAHRAFQHRHRERAYSARDWRDNPRLSIHLNPVRAWMRLVTTVLVGDQVALPAWVLCYPVESVLHAAALELAARKLILDLERQAPCTFGRFVSCDDGLGSDELIEIAQSLADVGIVAFD